MVVALLRLECRGRVAVEVVVVVRNLKDRIAEQRAVTTLPCRAALRACVV
jgi:hypothetical protein